MNRRADQQRGQSLLEFALVLPIFFLLLFGAIDLGRVIWAQDNLKAAAREAARYASVHGGSDVTGCPTGPNLAGSAGSGCTAWNPDSKEPTRSHARKHLIAPGGNVVITVCYFDRVACTGNADETNATNKRGEFVTVRISSRLDLTTGTLLGLGSFDLSGASTVLINN